MWAWYQSADPYTRSSGYMHIYNIAPLFAGLHMEYTYMQFYHFVACKVTEYTNYKVVQTVMLYSEIVYFRMCNSIRGALTD